MVACKEDQRNDDLIIRLSPAQYCNISGTGVWCEDVSIWKQIYSTTFLHGRVQRSCGSRLFQGVEENPATTRRTH
jgi:hypothetical protein